MNEELRKTAGLNQSEKLKVKSGNVSKAILDNIYNNRLCKFFTFHSPLFNFQRKAAFTLAEVLITLGVIGVVAAVALPSLMTNVQERVRKEQVRTAKYKLTLATDKMKSLGLLNVQYPTTKSFVDELQKHLKLAKVCDNNHLSDCWPTDEIEIPTKNGATYKDVNTLKTGQDIQALGLSTKNTQTMGIVTADGVPMILTYSPNCTPLDQARTYSWSTIDNKPETNATTNCISAVMDINGKAKPNRLGTDVRTWNSIMGSQRPGATALNKSQCEELKKKGLVNGCEYDTDYFAGAVKACHDLKLHLPSEQTLALIAGARYGRSDITPKTVISSVQFAKTNWGNQGDKSCEQIWRDNGYGDSDQVICIDNGTNTNMGNDDPNSSLRNQNGTDPIGGSFWSASESSSTNALRRGIYSGLSNWHQANRNGIAEPLCLGD